MRMRFFAAVLLALLLSPSLAAAQYRPQPVSAYLDAPAAGERVPQTVMFGGWALNWRTCRHVASVMLWRVNTATREFAIVPSTVYWGPRHDVQTYARWAGCPTAEIALGFTVVPNEPQPFGPWRYHLLITDLLPDPDSVNWKIEIVRSVIVQ
jgi:hypothetical protein